MKFFTTFSVVLTAIIPVFSLVVESREASSGSLDTRQVSTTCASPSAAVAFLRAVQPKQIDHFYTTSVSEMENAIFQNGYIPEGTPGNIFTTQQPSTVPLFRLQNLKVIDHFYTTSAAERDSAISTGGYISEGIAGFIYPTAECGGIPLFRRYSARQTDHFYTTSATEAQSSISQFGYADEGIAGFILPA
ncbi:hypothetical protein GALMADRAFT_730724 [Galerina marginata CBS 339.88]|uniref:DUF5648 domain-containing protein n=1 Tax=Galerina marginata (strain CBS 339.88) TaxID=685588 RepID=A0A067SQX1_GALM3|nr:hypothetical protein GALMADRAFT_730724 [Galerina marginata CBS 339.88]